MPPAKPKVRRLEEYELLSKEEFKKRFYERFADPAFDKNAAALAEVFETAWEGYEKYRKSPRLKKAGPDFADPDFKLPAEWLQTRAAIQKAQERHDDPKSPSRVLLVNGSTRSEHSCPGEISKTRRLAYAAREALEKLEGFEVDFLDLSLLAEEPWKVIHPCKACVSTAFPLCHWPCSCYPNFALGQTNDWMAELYPRWVAAHGVMIVCPVHWYQTPASLKLMMDRLVCADGCNPDPTTTRGKDPVKAKELELSGVEYEKPLAGRAFSVLVHADAAGPEDLRRMLVDWLTDMGLVQAGPSAAVDAYVGYYTPYATSHEDLDADPALFEQAKNAALSLAALIGQIRSGRYQAPDAGLKNPKEK